MVFGRLSGTSQVLIAPLLKSGKDPLNADAYRPIHLICVLAKAVSRLVERRICKAIGNPECQMAYVPKHSTCDFFTCLEYPY